MARDVLSSLASSRRRRFEREVFHLPGLPASYLEGEPLSARAGSRRSGCPRAFTVR